MRSNAKVTESIFALLIFNCSESGTFEFLSDLTFDPLFKSALRSKYKTTANSIMIAITNIKDVRRYIPKDVIFVPVGLLDLIKMEYMKTLGPFME